MNAANYARTGLVEDGIFPMPLDYPTYSWSSPSDPAPFSHIPGVACKKVLQRRAACSYCRMLDAPYEAVRRRNVAIAREQDCKELIRTTGRGEGMIATESRPRGT